MTTGPDELYRNKIPNLYTTGDMQPMVLETSFFDREHGPWTPFEEELLELVYNSPSTKGLKFSQKLSIVESMREAAYLMLQQLESK